MDKEKMKNVEENLKYYEELMEKDMVRTIVIKDKYGRQFGIGNPEGIKAMMGAAIRELERQFDIAKWGEPMPEEETSEYRLARKMEDGMNTFSFDEKAFVKGFLRMHRTLQQKFVRVMVACISALADEENYDDRNRASVALCRELKPIVEKHYLPFI